VTRLRICCIILVFCAATAIASPAQTTSTLVDFDGANGASPFSSLVQGNNGNFYGTTSIGGANVCNYQVQNEGCGTVFKITPAGALTTIYSFCSQPDCTDGADPLAGLVLGTDGNFYGTTNIGGGPQVCIYLDQEESCGTVFKITPAGVLTTLYSFCSHGNPCTDGQLPQAALTQGTDGNFYGTTYLGGAYGYGSVFQITPTGVLTTIYSFCAQRGCIDGTNPSAGLVLGTDGNLYGTTLLAGANCNPIEGNCGGGTVFKITPTGTLTTLYSFCAQPGCTDGSNPTAALVQATNGNFYGTTSEGGDVTGPDPYGYGTVFEITAGGVLTVLHRFEVADGQAPIAGLAQATDGNFYGTAIFGGAYSYGSVFKITPTGTLTTLYSFCAQPGCTDGSNPRTALVQTTNGNLYGTTELGGTSVCLLDNQGCGTVFDLSVGLGQFVETNPTSGPVGQPVTILGTSLTGTTTVRFNGTAAMFMVVSGSEITTTVPGGATTGTVEVTMPSGTLNSNVAFNVLTSPVPVPTTTNVGLSPSSVTEGSTGPVVLTATAAPALGSGTPTGTVTFFNGSNQVGTAALGGGLAMFDYDPGSLTPGSYPMIATYSGDSNFAGSISSAQTLTVTSNPSFQLSSNQTALTIVAGQSGTVTFTVTPENGFNSSVSFACSGLPAEATCAFSPTSVTPSGGAITSTLTITTTAPSTAMREPIAPSDRPIYALLFPGLAVVFGITARRKRTLRDVRIFGLLIILLVASELTSCGGGTGGSTGGGNSGTPVGTSTVSVTASTSGSGAIGQTATVTVTITE
jgi:uncharacterized repeat protein (TIGR03803 family)